MVTPAAIRALPQEFAVIEERGDIGKDAAAIIITNNPPAFGAMSWAEVQAALVRADAEVGAGPNATAP